MVYSKYNPKDPVIQLTLDLPAHLLPGYPTQGLLYCYVVCELYGWHYLGRLAAWQLDKVLEGWLE